MESVWIIFLGSFALSVVHAAIPNHWLPLVLLGKTEQWSNRQLAGFSAVTGLAHTLSTVFIGILVGALGVQLSTNYEFVTRVAAPSILIGMGVLYVFLGIVRRRHDHDRPHEQTLSQRSTLGLLFSLSIAMFFSPCTEIEVYYFTAAGIGWTGIWIVSVIYTVITVAGMILLTHLGRKGMTKIKLHFLDHHERTATGLILLLLGIVSLLMPG